MKYLRDGHKVFADEAFDTSVMETEQTEIEAELNVASDLMNQCIDENAHAALDQTEYQKKYDDLPRRFDDVKAKLELVKAQIADEAARRAAIEDFLVEPRPLNGSVTEFDPILFSRLVDFYTVYGKDDVRAAFKNGTEIKA